ncbi:MAG: hypothetical protein A4E28_00378 [Methanocella sp. PtaU1.Bin125]|nr:MAG: hypothetical protein A4E28_00378 [Methanocella sp. PtaU1.Bin125]
MTSAMVVTDRGNVFETLFLEQGMVCQQVTPPAFGSPYCHPVRLLIVPSGFAAEKYYKGVRKALERNADRIGNFIENGGIVLAFGAIVDDYDYDWLPVRLAYHMKFKEAEVRLVKPDDPAASFIRPGVLDCDGYFTAWDGDVVMVREEDRPVLVSRKYGKGHVVASALHQWPSPEFLRWACGEEREPLHI